MRILFVLVFLEPNPICPELAVGVRKKTAAFSLLHCWAFHKWSRSLREREMVIPPCTSAATLLSAKREAIVFKCDFYTSSPER